MIARKRKMLINNDTIVKDTDPVIRTVSAPVPLPLSKEDEQLLREMFQYVQDSTDEEKAERLNLRPAVGISAIQLGIPKQMTAVICDDVDNNDNPVHYEFMLVNPKIISSSVQKAYLHGGEGCLSVCQEHQGYVVRSARIKVKAFDLLQKSPSGQEVIWPLYSSMKLIISAVLCFMITSIQKIRLKRFQEHRSYRLTHQLRAIMHTDILYCNHL